MAMITVRSRGGFQHEIQAGDHVFYADEPVDVGGDDTGPNPYEILLGALGACTAITLQMYAKRKGWALGEIEIDLTHNKDYAKDCEDCENKNVRIDRITRKISFRGDLSSEQRQRLMEIARRCPVHQTLTEGQVEVEDEEVLR
jgi:putative redox protein